jgi:hypothetical protein
MTYFQAQSIYQDIAVNLQYCESLGQKQSDVLIEWIDKYGIEKIKDCYIALCTHLEEEKDHYKKLLEIAVSVDRIKRGK